MVGSRHAARALAAFVVLGAFVVFSPPSSAGPAFVFGCQYSHTLADDPIVYPRQPGLSHSHDFIGNTSTNSFTTRNSLMAEPTTCSVYGDSQADKSGYWLPTLKQLQADGTTWGLIHPVAVSVYYHGETTPPTAVQPFPAGFRMIAGDSKATTAQSTSIVSWSCGHAVLAEGPTKPHCIKDPLDPYDALLQLRLVFPRCWNGSDLDSPDHKGHMAYPLLGSDTCPIGYPTRLPEIRIFVFYRTLGGPDYTVSPVPGSVTLASGGIYSMHGDFMEAWDTVKLQALISRCLWNPLVSCTG